MAKVSVIMGVYNCEVTLCEAIASLVAQTYKDWELIMVDDGSTDSTYEIAKKYADKYDNIYVYQNAKNMGLNYTLNHCLKYINGEYVARMDGDDISLPERFQMEVDFLDSHPEYAIVSSPMIYFDDQGDFMVGKSSGDVDLKTIPRGTPHCHAACMVRSEAYKRVNGYSTSSKYLRVEDWDLWVRMYAVGYRGYNLSKPLYKMRDDRNAYRRRKFRYRINEARVSASAVKKLHLNSYLYAYVMRPILVGLLPSRIYNALHRNGGDTLD